MTKVIVKKIRLFVGSSLDLFVAFVDFKQPPELFATNKAATLPQPASEDLPASKVWSTGEKKKGGKRGKRGTAKQHRL